MRHIVPPDVYSSRVPDGGMAIDDRPAVPDPGDDVAAARRDGLVAGRRIDEPEDKSPAAARGRQRMGQPRRGWTYHGIRLCRHERAAAAYRQRRPCASIRGANPSCGRYRCETCLSGGQRRAEKLERVDVVDAAGHGGECDREYVGRVADRRHEARVVGRVSLRWSGDGHRILLYLLDRRREVGRDAAACRNEAVERDRIVLRILVGLCAVCVHDDARARYQAPRRRQADRYRHAAEGQSHRLRCQQSRRGPCAGADTGDGTGHRAEGCVQATGAVGIDELWIGKVSGLGDGRLPMARGMG